MEKKKRGGGERELPSLVMREGKGVGNIRKKKRRDRLQRIVC